MNLTTHEDNSNTWPEHKAAGNSLRALGTDVSWPVPPDALDELTVIGGCIARSLEHYFLMPNRKFSIYGPNATPVIDGGLISNLPKLGQNPAFQQQARQLRALIALTESSTTCLDWPTGRIQKGTLIPSHSPDATIDVVLPEIQIVDPFAGFEAYAQPDWDCYGAAAITSETLTAARQFYRTMPDTFSDPDIAPGSDGSIGLEWIFDDRNLRKFFIDIGPGKVWSFYWRLKSGESDTAPAKPIDEGTEAELAALFNRLSA